MKQIDSIAGKCYIATAPNGGTVTDEAGRTLATVEAGEQKAVWGTDGKLYLSDDDGKLVLATFNYALAVAGLLGGGADKLPAGYTRLEFLKGSGKQYIITDYYQSTSAGAEISADCELLGSGNVTISACGLVPTDNGSPWGFGLYSSGGKANFSPFSNKNLYYGSIQVLNKRCLFKLKANSLWIDGVEDTRNFYGTWSSSQAWYTARPLTLFGTPKPDEGWAPEGHVMKAYRFTASVSGKVERDFIPALDPTGAPCMYDLVTRTPFYNSGTGDFIYPGKDTQAATYSLRRPRQYAQMTERGIRRLYHVPRGYNGSPEEYAEQNGFKILVETPAPEEGYWTPVWHEREDCIELEWVETEPPEEELSNVE